MWPAQIVLLRGVNVVLRPRHCLYDIVLYAEEKVGGLTYFDVMETLKAICEHERERLAVAVAR